MEKTIESRKEKILFLMTLGLLIMIMILLYHAAKMEYKCAQICEEQTRQYKDLIKDAMPEEEWRLRIYEQNLSINRTNNTIN
jgi:hypothetical protein